MPPAPPTAAPPVPAASSTAAAPDAPPGPAGSSPECPHCHTVNRPGALFCEACGYDFTTGALPRGATAPAADAGTASPDASPAPLAPPVQPAWVAEIWVDPAWYAEQEADDPCPSPGLPAVVPLTVRSLLVGRFSRSRNIHPEIDCGSDVGVSRRQAQLTTDGSRWWIEDLQSSNGTYVGAASGPLPTVPLVPGERRELTEDDRVYIGAWTRIVVRRATEEELAAS
ncbi:FHA domain-containing protein [Actinotalea sp. M2MS4P-6]|uniref:FHA domain-containing protein n=1 Tax=Actinotalea sp. M2MS4P-6 TaxID=2983762 RepID=UPI0021E47763|nr:FHA domain-containing protein [Actinotalea sp. M2MS4P-6]MCV2393049.1 FHA domain-containing protein [Actinotalea sp. M2MS4P-6]